MWLKRWLFISSGVVDGSFTPPQTPPKALPVNIPHDPDDAIKTEPQAIRTNTRTHTHKHTSTNTNVDTTLAFNYRKIIKQLDKTLAFVAWFVWMMPYGYVPMILKPAAKSIGMELVLCCDVRSVHVLNNWLAFACFRKCDCMRKRLLSFYRRSISISSPFRFERQQSFSFVILRRFFFHFFSLFFRFYSWLLPFCAFKIVLVDHPDHCCGSFQCECDFSFCDTLHTHTHAWFDCAGWFVSVGSRQEFPLPPPLTKEEK